MPHTHCIAYKSDLEVCGNLLRGAARETGRCGVHERVHQRNVDRSGPLPEGRCVIYRAHGGWCPGHAEEGSLICANHRHIIDERARALRLHQRVENVLLEFRMADPRPTWDQVIDRVWAMADLTPEERAIATNRYFHWGIAYDPHDPINHAVFLRYRIWVANGRVGNRPDTAMAPRLMENRIAPPRLPQGLAAIAADNQNVHTTAVSKQTNDLTAKILERGGDDNRRHSRPADVIAYWLSRRMVTLHELAPLAADIDRYYNLISVSKTNDYAYRRLFNALTLIIAERKDDGDTRKELMKRFAQECMESVGMCAAGHMTRLCNVLVGFDDAFKPPVPVGEILQQKIAAIAGEDVPVAEKLMRAKAVMGDLGIPEADRAPWLEALEA